MDSGRGPSAWAFCATWCRRVMGAALLVCLGESSVGLAQDPSAPDPNQTVVPQTVVPPELALPLGTRSVNPAGEAKLSSAVVAASLKPPELQGPAFDEPKEILEMLNHRRDALDRREASILANESRLTTLRAELEKLVGKQEELLKKTEVTKQGIAQREAARKERDEKKEEEVRLSGLTQTTKIYETMPAEEAAARLEKMPPAAALQILRHLKGKTAGAILAAVRPDKAAKLTESLLILPQKPTNTTK